MADKIKIEIPAKSEYFSVVRLSVAGLAAKLKSDYETIEDLKVAVSESCLRVLKETQRDTIEMEFIIDKNTITIRIMGIKDKGEENLSLEDNLNCLIIESLVDELKYSDYGMEMKKYIGVDS